MVILGLIVTLYARQHETRDNNYYVKLAKNKSDTNEDIETGESISSLTHTIVPFNHDSVYDYEVSGGDSFSSNRGKSSHDSSDG